VLALAAMPDAEFDARLTAMKKGVERVRTMQRELMDEGTDYGVVGNTKRPTLLKPGAEKLCNAYGLVADFTPVVRLAELDVDVYHEPPISVTTRAVLYAGSTDGPVVAVGYGAANSWETRYRYRRATLQCPECSKFGTIVKSRGVWWCGPRDGGCNANIKADDPRITSQSPGQVDNPDPHDLLNTLVKMAEKRAYVDATLRATATSGLFTQDIEDMAPASAPPEGPQNGSGAAATPVVAQVSGGQPAAAQGAPEEPPGMFPDSPTRPNDPLPRNVTPIEAAQAAADAGGGPHEVMGAAMAADGRTVYPAEREWKPVTDDPTKCPKHNRPWRSGQRGYYCSAKDETGAKGYCEQVPSAAFMAQAER
jgi:hypothetical protein